MMATIMQALDGTIANVALPSIQGSLSATQEQVAWVITSYIVSAAIATPLAGFCAVRFGVRRILVSSVIGFTIASMLCGAAQTLPQLVLFRTMQGVFGAALVPLSQALMMEAYPREEQGKAMAMWGVGTMLGPITGPTLGGWLTDEYTWRWVFYINLPVGILCAVGLMILIKNKASDTPRPFDLLGFTLLSIAIGTFQLMLDRGEQIDWFGSREIIIEAAVAGIAAAMFVIHMLSSDHPFLPRDLFRDRNLMLGHHLHGHHRPADDRDRDLVAALPAAAEGLSGLHHGHRHGAARHRHDDLDVHGVAPDRQGRRAMADRDRAQPVRHLVVRHDAVLDRRQRRTSDLERLHAGHRARPGVPAAHHAGLRHRARPYPHRGRGDQRPDAQSWAPRSAWRCWWRCSTATPRSTAPCSPST